jgi:hypothetical protein
MKITRRQLRQLIREEITNHNLILTEDTTFFVEAKMIIDFFRWLGDKVDNLVLTITKHVITPLSALAREKGIALAEILSVLKELHSSGELEAKFNSEMVTCQEMHSDPQMVVNCALAGVVKMIIERVEGGVGPS